MSDYTPETKAWEKGWEQGFSDCLAFFGSEPAAHELERALAFFGRVTGETK